MSLHAATNDDARPTLTRSARADPRAVTAFRRDLRRWLDDVIELDTDRKADVVLATDEALANCADHAYRGRDTPGLMTLQVSYDPKQFTLSVCVTDHGVWVEPDFAANPLRGRGILLMRAIADDVTVRGTGRGTTVCLEFRFTGQSQDWPVAFSGAKRQSA
ncbi:MULTISPECIES: ATP-binding protein [unclassified Mycobacterium]|uniref:ATP-binding protein n=1 Tax=unclassified Mycobacterium TaxID=2642494 RepID=UPI0007FF3F0D|nr:MULTISPECIES: ATP-binding protein [unclassified Mycobacterium]OBG72660.1 hypothetical protein A5700_08765 [Mycobacterium sp. E1214]OBH31356.1 hypothetical protein A5693_16935 [Mycobacterium sp. E1319]